MSWVYFNVYQRTGWTLCSLLIICLPLAKEPQQLGQGKLGDVAGGGSVERSIVLFDLTPAFGVNFKDLDQRRQFYDLLQLVFALQGIVNRDEPRLFVRFDPEVDDFWWGEIRKEWLVDWNVERVFAPRDLVKQFRQFVRGLVVWDERVPATSNVASTIAGAEHLLPVRYDPREGFLYALLTGDKELDLKTVVDLHGSESTPMFRGEGEIPGTGLSSTGSPKCDAYLWLVEKYLRTGKLNPAIMGYYIDAFWLHAWKSAPPENCMLSNHDYVIARGGLIFDLNVWDDEVPVDDREQRPGTDYRTLCTLLRAAWDRLKGKSMIQVCGFVPWAYKYTSYKSSVWAAGGRHSEVETEWQYAAILSCFNAYMDADALSLGSMANASVYMHFPLLAAYPQRDPPTRQQLIGAGLLEPDGKAKRVVYFAHYVGDYDSAAWLYRKLPELWRDPYHGLVQLSWAFNPNLADRFAFGMHWARKNATSLDYFVAGDSGAGYLNPSYLVPPRPHSGLPSGLSTWEEHCTRWYKQWGITVTGFVIDGFARPMDDQILDAYARFSPNGVVAQKIPQWGLHGQMPFVRMRGDIGGDVEQAARTVAGWITTDTNRPLFLVARSVLKTPTWYYQLNQRLQQKFGDSIRIIDLYTLMTIIREHAKASSANTSSSSSLSSDG